MISVATRSVLQQPYKTLALVGSFILWLMVEVLWCCFVIVAHSVTMESVVHSGDSRRDSCSSKGQRMVEEPPSPHQPTNQPQVVSEQYSNSVVSVDCLLPMANITNSAGDAPCIPFVVPCHAQGEITSYGLFKLLI